MTLALLAASACADATGPDEGVHFSLYLTDAPGDVTVWVSFSEVYLQGEDGRTPLLPATTDLIELTALVGLVEELTDDIVLPMYSAGQLRVVIDQAVLEDGDGNVFTMGGAVHPEGLATTGDLRCPSCGTSGLKVRLTQPDDELVLTAGSATLLLDFDVAQSFGRSHSRGGTQTWIMRPTIVGTLVQGEEDDGVDILPQGAIRGSVQLPFFTPVPDCPAGTRRDLTSFVPTAFMAEVQDDDGNPLRRTGSTSSAGTFEIPFLAAGGYTLGNVAMEFDTHRLVFNADPIPGFVTVMEDQVVSGVNYRVTSMACEPLQP